MTPVLSTKSPYDIKRILDEAQMLFLQKKPDKVQIHLVLKKSPKHYAGFLLNTDTEGIIADGSFVIPIEDVDKATVTKDINEGICVWLELSKLEKFIKNE